MKDVPVHGRVGTSFAEAVAPLEAALRAAGIDPTDFGRFVSPRAAPIVGAASFEHARAVPTLLQWLPRVDHPDVQEAIVRSLTGQPAARREGPARLIAAFVRPDNANQPSLLWAIANALATLAGPADANDLIELIQDRRYGTARQMPLRCTVKNAGSARERRPDCPDGRR